ncbi:MAG: hypothetical protein VW338_05025 [Rhodospirillaceae bacterium]
MLRYIPVIAAMFLVGCAGVVEPAPKPAAPVAECVSFADVAGGVEPAKVLKGKAAADFFAATGGASSGLPAPDMVAIFALPNSPAHAFVAIFRDGCAYGRGIMAMADAMEALRASLGPRA